MFIQINGPHFCVFSLYDCRKGGVYVDILRDEDCTEIYDLLCSLGVTANYIGFFYITYAICLVRDEPQKLALVTKKIYPEIARKFGTSWQAVERNIRTAIDVAWNKNPQLLSGLAHHHLKSKPTASQFISIVSSSFFN